MNKILITYGEVTPENDVFMPGCFNKSVPITKLTHDQVETEQQITHSIGVRMVDIKFHLDEHGNKIIDDFKLESVSITPIKNQCKNLQSSPLNILSPIISRLLSALKK